MVRQCPVEVDGLARRCRRPGRIPILGTCVGNAAHSLSCYVVASERGQELRNGHCGRIPPARLLYQLALLTDGLTAILLPSTHAVCYPFIEVERAHNSLYPGKPHIVSDDVAHPCESDRDALVFYLLDEA